MTMLLRGLMQSNSSIDVMNGTATATTTTTTVVVVKLGGDLHWLIVAVMVGLLFALTGLSFYLLYPYVKNYILRKIPVNLEKIKRRYQTIDCWIVTKVRWYHSIEDIWVVYSSELCFY
jgi:hypothetical protein